MTPIHIDGERALRLLRQVVAGNEDYVYEGPDPWTRQYAHGDDCGCLIGHVLRSAGATMDQLRALDSGRWVKPVGVLDVSWLSLTDLARCLLGLAQRRQDNGHPWGEVLADAESYAVELGISVSPTAAPVGSHHTPAVGDLQRGQADAADEGRQAIQRDAEWDRTRDAADRGED